MTDVLDRRGDVAHPILDVLADRWSPRAYDPNAEISDAELDVLLEAARWAPSAANSQPSRYIVGRRGSEVFRKIVDGLMGFNQAWAPRSAALIVGVVVTTNPDGTPRRWAEYDLGQALAHLSVQAHADGWLAHQMGGIEVAKLTESFGLTQGFVPVTVTAIGRAGDIDQLDEKARARELAERTRLELGELVLVRA